MTGVKGRSGGPRPGSGRKPKAAVKISAKKDDALKLLIDIAFGRVDANANQVRAAVAAVQYTHTRRSDGGKREAVQEAAKEATGKFSGAAEPPKLVAAGGKKL